MHAVLAIAIKDIVLLFRDKGNAFFTFIFPILIALFFGAIFGGAYGGGGGSALDVALVVLDKGPAAAQFSDDFIKSDGLQVQTAATREEGETLVDAVVRETLEETAWAFEPTGIVGVYLWRPEQGGRTFLRVAFRGELTAHHPDRPLDRGILRTRWLSREQLLEPRIRLRSPLVLTCLDDWLGGTNHPLALLTHLIARPTALAASG